MTNEQIKTEFARWVDTGRPSVWVRDAKDNNTRWSKLHRPSWDSNTMYYVTDDKHAELRKLQIDKPDIKLQIKSMDGCWIDAVIVYWDINAEYRAKPKEWYEDPNIVGKPIWARELENSPWYLDVFKEYNSYNFRPFKCERNTWKYAKPVKPGKCYKGVENDE